MFIRVLSASLEQSPNIVLKAECGSVTAWVTSPQVKDKWEELSRLYGGNVTVLPGAKVTVSAKGLRIAIPNGYVLSELILNINLVLKSLRHLHRVISLGRYIPLESPGAEPPKQLLVINIFIRSTTLEAADNSFESKLGLIWRTGFQAQKIRRERELAFEAKLRAIMTSGDSEVHVDSSPQSDIRYRFTSKRSTSLADARTRLNMVHSNSWINSMSRQKDEIGKKENAILRQLRHATNTIGLHVPLPIATHTPEKTPPLFRAVVSGLSVCLAPPNFPAGYEGFLCDLGGMPYSTEYSLLLPMHLKCSLDAAMMNIRDYPLPLLSVPFHVDGPSLEFDTDLVIAEEVGSTDSVEWFECPVIPHNAGIAGASAFVIQVPKTIMPVKSYANPSIRFCTKSVTEFTWGVSYNPAVQEVMRVVGNLYSLGSVGLI
jgi:FMP27, sixth RBG unit/Fmp27, SW motif RBG repeat/Fmp27/BLTP2/Hobbit, GFWDK motif-containg RBG unit